MNSKLDYLDISGEQEQEQECWSVESTCFPLVWFWIQHHTINDLIDAWGIYLIGGI